MNEPINQHNATNNNMSTIDNPTVCFCYIVKKAEIVEAIEKGADSVHKIQTMTNACMGCGSCEYDLLDLLTQYSTKS
jgi:NAD(P)H-nitrite reductase large subunit